ncbi:peptidylprolyl isomerase [Desemzia sp. RIT804]|uniref:peptidylprolyl isomerase n=1 Tax=Desemzia sp. RIT 804 TaxID=2810209 RepID=UPI00194FBAA8|nr:peptidylprolyl isomerase [Desemzia sp. RIT 804]MBM6613415.1 peptidylprolyl isomerase [Desemzia sp. RIT 804]
MKKMLLTATAVLAGFALAGCSDNSVASTTAGKISQDDLYEEMKESYGAATLQQMIITDVLEKSYGDVVNDEAVDASFEEEAAAYGGAEGFEYVLSSSGYTADSYKDLIRYSLLIEEAVKDKTTITDEEIQAAYDSYVAPVTASHILVADEETANSLIEELNNGADFATLAQENSTDQGTAANGGQLTFTTGEMVAEFEEAAFALEEGEMTQEPVQSTFGFHIIKMDEKPEKGTLEEETEVLTEQILNEKLANDEYVFTILSGILQDANIQITDKDLEGVMDTFLMPEETDTPSEESIESGESTDESGESTDESGESSDDSTTEESSEE